MNYGGDDLNLEATELRLGLPGSDGLEQKQSSPAGVRTNKRASPDVAEESRSKSNNNSIVSDAGNGGRDTAPPPK